MNFDEGSNKKIALLIETSNAYSRGVLHGIAAYMKERGNWSVQLAEGSRGNMTLDWLKYWRGDGIIARIENHAIRTALAGLAVPIVDVSASRLVPALPWVETDDETIARMAVEHLRERGFKHFAYCGNDEFNWSVLRERHFVALLNGCGYGCDVFHDAPAGSDNQAELARLGDWLARLPKPVGVFCCYDFQGRQVLDACRRKKLGIPDEIAVLGVDNDELLCELADPPMSSIIPDTYRTGYEAARLLDRMMNGETPLPSGHLIKPLGIATRRSSDVVALDDPDTAAALRFIRDHAHRGICVKDVLAVIPVSRRLLEYRFKKYLGRTPHDEIIRARINRVKTLLTESDLPLEKLAERCGFSHVEYLSAAFRRECGMPPGQYRALHKSGSGR